MKISVDEIPQSPKEIKFSESIEELNELYRRTNNRDFSFPPYLAVDLVYYRSGVDIFFNGRVHGELTGCCGRCLENYSFTLDKEFDFVLTPDTSSAERRAEELHIGDLVVSYYSAYVMILQPML